MPAVEPSSPAPAARLLRFLHALALAAVVVGVGLLFHDLDANGSTADERSDFRIARDFVAQGTIFENKEDPSQSRLPHIVAALSMAAFGETLWAFKLPFALATLLAGALLFAFVRRRHGALTALYCLAFFFTNPWVLGSGRTAATAGDMLLVVTSFAFLWAAIRVFGERGVRPPSLAATAWFGLTAGLAVGAKLISLVLLPAGLALVAVRRRSFAHVVAFGLVAAITSVALHPLLVTHTRPTLGATFKAFGTTPFAMEGLGNVALPETPAATTGSDVARRVVPFEPVEVEDTPKLRYLAYLLVGKLTLPFLAVLGLGVALGLGAAWRDRRLDPAFWGALAFVTAPCVVLIWKYKQNAGYYLPLLIPAVTLAALALDRGLRSPKPWRRTVVAAGWLAIVGYQLWLDVGLAPDYLQAGRRLGIEAQGKMAGPATNHCQGTPVLIDRLNQLRARGEAFDVARVFDACMKVMLHDEAHGPAQRQGYRFGRYSPGMRPAGEHVFVVHDVLFVNAYGTP